MPELPSEPEPAAAAKTTWTVSDVLAFDDADLAEYMRQHRRPDGGGFELDDIDGWDVLPDGQRDQLAQRLKCCSPRPLSCCPRPPAC